MSSFLRKNLEVLFHSKPLTELARQYPIHLDKVPGKKVIIVATRAPKIPLSGGMAPAVKQACSWADYKLWYAYGTTAPEGTTERVLKGAFNALYKKTVPISQYDVEGFRVRQVVADNEAWDLQYNNYCNQIVWPVCHNQNNYSKDLENSDIGGNFGANETLAKRIAQDLGDDTTTPIWIHDYHHLPLASALRRQGVKNPIVYFHHIPLPTMETLCERGEAEKVHFKNMAKNLLACDAVLFQTEETVQRFFKILDMSPPQSTPAYQGHFISTKANPSGRVYIGHAPISIDTKKEMKIATQPDLKTERAKILDSKLVAENILINFERCDYSKGILERVEAFKDLMEQRPDLRGKVQLVLGAEPTRGGIREYEEYAEKVKEKVAALNARQELWAQGYEPVIFSNENIDHDDVVRLMRNRKEGQRRIGLVTPYEDGMNLTAKEFAVAQDVTNAGPLVLSSGAGTASEMRCGGQGAIIYDKVKGENVAPLVEAIAKAIDMPQDEANARAVKMQNHLKKNDIQRWAQFHETIFTQIQAGTFQAPKPFIPALQPPGMR